MTKEEKMKYFNENPNFCINCGKKLDNYNYKLSIKELSKIKFCSRGCTGKYYNKSKYIKCDFWDDDVQSLNHNYGIIGIYCIENTVNNKRYIGKSINIDDRWRMHIYELNNNSHHNKHLQNAWNKYGEECFNFYILEKCDESLLNSKEIFYISKFNSDSMKYGYNLNHGGNTRKAVSDSTKEKIKNTIKNNMNNGFIPFKVITDRTILQIDKNFNIVNEWNCSPMNIQKNSNGKYTAVCIYRCLKHTAKTHKKFMWIYLDEYENVIESIKQVPGRQYSKNKVILKNKIYQYDFYGNLIKIWDSWNDIRDAGYKQKSIMNVCTGYKKTYKGFVWSRDLLEYNEIMSHVINNRKIKFTPDKSAAS